MKYKRNICIYWFIYLFIPKNSSKISIFKILIIKKIKVNFVILFLLDLFYDCSPPPPPPPMDLGLIIQSINIIQSIIHSAIRSINRLLIKSYAVS